MVGLHPIETGCRAKYRGFEATENESPSQNEKPTIHHWFAPVLASANCIGRGVSLRLIAALESLLIGEPMAHSIADFNKSSHNTPSQYENLIYR